ncbi:TonB-dependent siderophore receptor [Methylobacillus arboreus]|uniref:TonB-dependent siderophore receptor n=1 Tax=Methylobacillus arboreus TaxID=755170 RepID=UPI001E4D2227|nr:TonB-dependent siderophore receptor [Methylobacillus arboreus]MCB5189491.1 TonB-dependent siderophore receptor [Methylobacillus arboreus]
MAATPFAKKKITHAILLGLALGASISAMPRLHAAEQQANTATQQYAIAAGTLDSALGEFGRITGRMVAIDPALTHGIGSKGLQGRYTEQQALSALLLGSGLEAVAAENGGYRLRKASSMAGDAAASTPGNTTLPEVAVTASKEKNYVTEGSGSYTTKSMSTATKLALSIRETPQSVTVVTRQQIEDQDLVTINDAVMKTPGLSMQKIGAERYNLYARGFPIDNVMYDGLPITLGASADTVTPANLAMYDRIEVVRGANGLIQGSGNPSAAINLVRKRPTATSQSSIVLSAGSWDNYRGELDASGPLLESGKLRGRIVATYQDGNSFQDRIGKEHSMLYAIGEADLTDSTTLTLSFSHQNENNNVAWGGGLPTATNGSNLHLSRSTSFVADWEYWDKKTDSLFVEIKHQFSNDWLLRAAANKSWSELNYLGGYPGRLASNLSSLGYRVSGGTYDDTQSSYDLYLSGPFQLLGRTHEFVTGYSYRDDDYNSNGSGTSAVATISDPNSFNPSSWTKPNVNMNTWRDNRDMTQEGVYATTRFSLSDQLKLIAGARLDWYDYQYIYNWQGSISTTESKETRHLTRYAGLLYDLDQQHTLYASYTDIFQPQSNRNAGGQLLEPIEGKNYEIGIKGEYFEGALNASIALFQIDQENRAKEVGDPTICASYPSTICYEAEGKVRSQGVELELNGAITPNWQLATGYTFTDAKYKKDSNKDNEGSLFDPDLPRHQFKLTTMYTLPGELNRWRVGGSFYHQSSVFNKGITAGQQWKIEQDSYSLVDLTAGYKASEHLSILFALNNVFDKKYYQTIGQNVSSWPTTFYGAPRNVRLTLRYDF